MLSQHHRLSMISNIITFILMLIVIIKVKRKWFIKSGKILTKRKEKMYRIQNLDSNESNRHVQIWSKLHKKKQFVHTSALYFVCFFTDN